MKVKSITLYCLSLLGDELSKL